MRGREKKDGKKGARVKIDLGLSWEIGSQPSRPDCNWNRFLGRGAQKRMGPSERSSVPFLCMRLRRLACERLSAMSFMCSRRTGTRLRIASAPTPAATGMEWLFFCSHPALGWNEIVGGLDPDRPRRESLRFDPKTLFLGDH